MNLVAESTAATVGAIQFVDDQETRIGGAQ